MQQTETPKINLPKYNLFNTIINSAAGRYHSNSNLRNNQQVRFLYQIKENNRYISNIETMLESESEIQSSSWRIFSSSHGYYWNFDQKLYDYFQQNNKQLNIDLLSLLEPGQIFRKSILEQKSDSITTLARALKFIPNINRNRYHRNDENGEALLDICNHIDSTIASNIVENYNFYDILYYDNIWQDEESKTLHLSTMHSNYVERKNFLDITPFIESLKVLENQQHYILFDESYHKEMSPSIISFPDNITNSFLTYIDQVEDQTKYEMVDMKKLCRGSGPTIWELKEKSLKAFSKGYKLLPIKFKNIYLDPTDQTEKIGYVYCYISNFSLRTVRKYRKANSFLLDFKKKLNLHEGSFFYDIDKFNSLEKKKFGQNNLYWDQMTSMFQNSNVSYNLVKSHSLVKETSFNPNLYQTFSKVKETKTNPFYKKYFKINSTLTQLQSKISKLDNSKNTITRRKERCISNVKNLEIQLVELKKNLQEINNEAKEIEENLPSYRDNYENLLPKLNEAKEKYDKYLSNFSEEILTSTEESKYKTNFEKQGIIVDSVEYRNIETNNTFLLKDPKMIIESMKSDPKIVLNTVNFRIVKPVTIYVDRAEKGDACKKVIGGPYIVKCSNNNLEIGLLSTASIFGYNKSNSQVFVHPHANASTISTVDPETFWSNLLNGLYRGCLGEASAAIHTAFKTNDLRQVILACMTWITSANSSDTWGKNYKYFPTKDQLKQENTEIKITKSFIEGQGFEDLITDSNEILNLLSDIMPEEEQRLQEEDEQIIIPPEITENINRLRTAGHPNYQPLYGERNET